MQKHNQCGFIFQVLYIYPYKTLWNEKSLGSFSKCDLKKMTPCTTDWNLFLKTNKNKKADY